MLTGSGAQGEDPINATEPLARHRSRCFLQAGCFQAELAVPAWSFSKQRGTKWGTQDGETGTSAGDCWHHSGWHRPLVLGVTNSLWTPGFPQDPVSGGTGSRDCLPWRAALAGEWGQEKVSGRHSPSSCLATGLVNPDVALSIGRGDTSRAIQPRQDLCWAMAMQSLSALGSFGQGQSFKPSLRFSEGDQTLSSPVGRCGSAGHSSCCCVPGAQSTQAGSLESQETGAQTDRIGPFLLRD